MHDPAPDYHAHIYFDANSRERAFALRQLMADRFPNAAIGRFHEKEVGPHPRWSCQIAFPLDQFNTIVPWLMINRGGLTIFLHPNSGDELADHRDHAVWMGEILPLNLSIFQ